MSEFSYLSVLVSIILSLAITQLLAGFGWLVQARARVQMYWPSIVWAGVLLLLDVQTWWSMFGLREHRNWNFFAFLVVLVQPVALYLLAVLAFPHSIVEGTADMHENYHSQAGWFFGLIVAIVIASVAKEVVISGSLPARLNLAAHVVFLSVTAPAIFTQQERYHELLALLAGLMFLVYIGLLFARLP
jgi:hypothetical protein